MPDDKNKDSELYHAQCLEFAQKIATNPGKKNVAKDTLIGTQIPLQIKTKEEQ